MTHVVKRHVEALHHAELCMCLVMQLSAQALIGAKFDDGRLQLSEVLLLLRCSSLAEAECIERVESFSAAEHIGALMSDGCPSHARSKQATIYSLLLTKETLSF